MVVDVPTESLAVTSSIKVLGARQVGDVVWVEVQFEMPAAPGRAATFEPFLLVDGRWMHGWVQSEAWSDYKQVRSQHFILHYTAFDAPAIEGLLPYLDSLHERAGADLGLQEALPATEVFILPPIRSATSSTPNYTGVISVPSPYATLRSSDITVQEHLRTLVGRQAVEGLVAYQVDPYSGWHPISVAFMRWELAQMGISPDPALERLLLGDKEGEELTSASLERLVRTPPLGFNSASPTEYLMVEVLLDLLIETYGPEAVPALIHGLPGSQSTDDWLYRSLGVHFHEVKALWQARLSAALPE